ncbi:MAG: methionyl-tRNA formyltransferase [Spirochaetota bacterium]
MRVLFAGTPEIAVPSLEAVAAEHRIVGVLTNPDRARGRKKAPAAPPVKEKAMELGLPVFQPPTLKREARELLTPLNADILAVFAYGRIFGPKFLALFPRGGVNVHPSLLPFYRGSIPVIAPIVNGDAETGVTVQQIALEMDTGDILAQRHLALDPEITAGRLTADVSRIGAELLVETLSKLEAGTVNPVPQDPFYATYCRKLNKNDGQINWQLPNYMIERMVRGFFPWPKAFTVWKGQQLTILYASLPGGQSAGRSSDMAEGTPGTVLGIDRENGILVQTGIGLLAIKKLQLQGKKPLEWQAFVNGHKEIIGSQLGDNA